MLPLHTYARVTGMFRQPIAKVLRLQEALSGRFPFERTIVDLRGDTGDIDEEALSKIGFAGVLEDAAHETSRPLPVLHGLARPDVVAPGDVIRIQPSDKVSVLFRRSANANFLFATERCNSLCLMCSQPPRQIDDSWRVQEILDVIALIDPDVPALGLTGGEPTLLGADLNRIIAAVGTSLPRAQFNILTNGRLLANDRLADIVCRSSSNVMWAVPLYADNAARHDHVVQAKGAFEETLNGLYNLAERRQNIEIRMVLHALTIGHLQAFAEFVYRNLPFVCHVAFMGLEPMGFAKVNREILYVDPMHYRNELENAVWYLHDRGIRASIYNMPLCLLSRSAWQFAKKSISDWKNKFESECTNCCVKGDCCGFFKSAGENWRGAHIHSIEERLHA